MRSREDDKEHVVLSSYRNFCRFSCVSTFRLMDSQSAGRGSLQYVCETLLLVVYFHGQDKLNGSVA